MMRVVLALLLIAGCQASPEDGTESSAPPVRVRVVEARRGEIDAVLPVTGETAALRTLRLPSPVAGRITFLATRAGDRLAEGEIAARVVPLESEAALQGFALLDETRALGGAERQTVARLRRELGARDVALRSPFAALVSDRLHNPGEQVAAGDVLLELFDPRSLYVLAQVPIDSAGRVRSGMPVAVSGSGIEGRGEVSAVLASLEPATLTVPVRIALAATPERPLVHAPVLCRITTAHHRHAILIPRSALVTDDGSHRGEIMVAVGGAAKRRVIRIGVRTATDVEVRRGIAVGEPVLAEGQYALPDGIAIEPVASLP